MALADLIQSRTALSAWLKPEKLSFWLFALSITLLPVLLGGNRPRALALAELGLAASFFLYAFSAIPATPLPLPRRLVWALGFLTLAVVWALVQTLAITPSSWAHPLWDETARVLGRAVPGSIAISPEAARAGLVRLLVYILAGCGAYVFAQDVSRARRFIQLVWYTGVLICLYGLTMRLLGVDKILWIDKWSYKADLTGTFVNRNHFAIYAGTILMCGFALFLQSWREHMSIIKPSARIKAFQAWLLKEGLGRLFGLGVVTLCLLFSHSRAGLMLSLFGLCCTAFLTQIYRRRFRLAVVIVFLGTAALALTAWLASTYLERFAHVMVDDSSQSRFKVYDLMVRAIGDNPLLGYGLNGFSALYRLYQPGLVLEFNRGHSDILEMLLDYGLPAASLVIMAFVLIFAGLWHGITTRRRNGLFAVLGLAAGLMVILHTCVDFSLQIPGIAMLWAALLGTGLAQSWSRSEGRNLSDPSAG